MSKYEIVIYWSDEDQVFVAKIPQLPGCFAHGATKEAARASVLEAISHWIETEHEFSDPIPTS